MGLIKWIQKLKEITLISSDIHCFYAYYDTALKLSKWSYLNCDISALIICLDVFSYVQPPEWAFWIPNGSFSLNYVWI